VVTIAAKCTRKSHRKGSTQFRNPYAYSNAFTVLETLQPGNVGFHPVLTLRLGFYMYHFEYLLLHKWWPTPPGYDFPSQVLFVQS